MGDAKRTRKNSINPSYIALLRHANPFFAWERQSLPQWPISVSSLEPTTLVTIHCPPKQSGIAPFRVDVTAISFKAERERNRLDSWEKALFLSPRYRRSRNCLHSSLIVPVAE
jgi:hypothetical protein